MVFVAEHPKAASVDETPAGEPHDRQSKAKALFIVTDGFEQSELFDPRQALLDAGAQATLALTYPRHEAS